MTNTVYITVGVPASGKSTWAREMAKANGWVISCRDDIRAAHGWTDYGNPKEEARITKIQRSQIEAALLEGMDVIVADTNIQPKFRNQLVKFAHQHGADAIIMPFPISLDEAIWRDSQRDAKVGVDVINRMYNQLQSQELSDEPEVLPVQTFEPYEHTLGLPEAIIVDIDGTVAKHWNRSPYEYAKVIDDKPIHDVIDVVKILSRIYAVVFVSGREDSCMNDTLDWIIREFGQAWYYRSEVSLFMRKSKDQRPDWVIKNEIYDRHVLPSFNVKMVFDDRDQVVNHLRRRGITVAQVAQGRF